MYLIIKYSGMNSIILCKNLIKIETKYHVGFPDGSAVKNAPVLQEIWV